MMTTSLAESLANADPISTWQGYSVCVLCGAEDPTTEHDHREFCVCRAAQTWHRELFGGPVDNSTAKDPPGVT